MITARSTSLHRSAVRHRDRGYLALLLVFVVLLPIWTPRLYATDSVQYYVYLRSLFFDGDLDFRNEYARFHELHPGSGIDVALLPRPDPETGRVFNVDPDTGMLINVAPVGSAILWAPAFLLAHGGVLLAQLFGSPVAADGYSAPYIVAISAASLLYGLGGLLLSYAITRRFAGVWPAAIAAVVCWLASPLVFYMYISPPWSHTGGLFAVALLIWYWLRTREQRTTGQWVVLGVLGGLMVMNREQLGLFLLLPALEGIERYGRLLRGSAGRWSAAARLLAQHALFLAVFVVSLTPQLLAYQTLNGRIGPSRVVMEKLGKVPDDPYAHGLLGSGHFWDTLIDARPSPVTGRFFAHGALLWTPAWALGILGLALLWRRDRRILLFFGLALFAQVWVNGRFGTTWHLSGAFGFRRLIEATPIFVLGLALLIERSRLPRPATALLALLLVGWNVGLIYQWTVLGQRERELRQGLVWDSMIRHQLAVPQEALSLAGKLLWERGEFYDATR